MKIRTLIVDDEPLARDKLRHKLSEEPDLEIVGEAGNGEEAIRAIGELRPHLVFLDVQMPPPNGLEVLRAVRDEWLPCTIFTTAHAQHAVEAFELHAVDYLLKPFNEERLATEKLSTLNFVFLHVVDTVGMLHAAILRLHALIMPVQTLVLTGGH